MKKRNSSGKYIAGLILLIALCVFGAFITTKGITKKKIGRASNIELGLDLAGGVSITYEVDGKNVSDSDMKDTVYKLQKRVEGYSTEAEVYQEGKDRINIEIPGVTDANKILDELGKPGTLSFAVQKQVKVKKNGKTTTQTTLDTVLTGQNVKKAKAVTNQNQTTGKKEYLVALEFDAKGTKAFAKATKANIGKPIYIIYDNQVISAPNVQEAITKGECTIDGMESYEAAENLASSIRIGSLPVKLNELRSNVVSAKLGVNAIQTTVKAGVIGFVLVCLIMIAFYAVPGMIACVALAIYMLMMLLALNGFNATLTLPGLAGIILGIGMAVDANVIIYARIQEEIGAGKSTGAAIKSGFGKAASAIIDGNVTTLIAVLVLWFKGSGTVKGFAQTLGMSVLISMFTALVISRFLVYAAYHFGLRDKKWYGKPRTIKTRDFVRTGKKYVAVAGVIILIGLAALPMNRSKIGSILNYDLEFSGGTASTITFKDDQKVNDSLEKQVVKAYEKVSKSTSVQSQKVKANNQMVVKSVELNLSQRKQIESTLKKDYKVKSVTTENISSTISNEMQRDAFISVVISAICMLIYIAIRFKDVKFGSSAIIALINDVLVVFAAYSVGRLSVGGTFIACMLTIIGYSINSTIVIFDRIRENLKLQTIRTRDDIKALVNQSISSTLVRTINTSLTTFVMVLALFICGVSSLREFALALMVGVIGGAFSSVFLTGPLWYMMKTRIGSDAVKENQAASQAQPEKITANPNRKKKKKKKKRRKGRVLSALIITFAVIAVSVVVSALTMTFGRDLLGINNDTKTRIVNIPSGSNTSEIADILKEAGIISHPKVFTFFAGRSDKDGQFTAGEHELRPDMAYETIFEELASPAMNEAGTVQIAFPEGINLREAADMLESTGVCKAEEFLEFFNKNAKYGYTYESHLPSFVNEKFYPMEGYLFPDTYIFYEDMDVDLVCQKILENFNSKITQEYYERMDELNLSLDQTLTLASMIQAEAGTVDQMTKISSVFWNRLNHPNEYPKLQSDPTTNYVEDVIKPNIKKADPELYAAYDTYQSNGLPPGAICNPGMDAIRAALYPAETDYYYFYSNLDTKETYFSRTLQEHETIMEKVERTRQPAVTTKDSQEETQVVFGVGTSVATEPPTDEYGNLLTTTETQSEENGE